ncbi:MAG: glycerol kinase GlpK [Oscillospiraceae bacterium]|nr:glycerol kinase GlpK [Oscillospiraceae bacterium]
MNGSIIALDQGTTSSRAIVFSRDGDVLSMAQFPITQHYPRPGWVEHDPNELWQTTALALSQAFRQSGLSPSDIEAIGITNQRETAVLWDRASGRSVYNAIVWQCRRTADICRELEERGLGGYIREKTGLIIDAYFTGTKFKWMFDNDPSLRDRAAEGALLGGTVDSWIIWNLTGSHVTDHSNASRTMLFDISSLTWDPRLCDELEVPMNILPRPVSNSELYGKLKPGIPGLEELAGIPVCGCAGDQQAALFGQCCFEEGMLKNTYGTGCFTMMNTGSDIVRSGNDLVSTVGWTVGGKTVYCLEGSVFNAGSTIQWLRDGLGLFEKASDCDVLAESVPDSAGMYIVPAFTGLGAPYWDMDARGLICGITRGATKAHLARAVLESISFQTAMLINAMRSDTGRSIHQLRVDGGASVSDFMMQFQADILDINVVRSSTPETTAAGAAHLAGLAAGVYSGTDQLTSLWKTDRVFVPQIDAVRRESLMKGWDDAVKRTLMKP